MKAYLSVILTGLSLFTFAQNTQILGPSLGQPTYGNVIAIEGDLSATSGAGSSMVHISEYISDSWIIESISSAVTIDDLGVSGNHVFVGTGTSGLVHVYMKVSGSWQIEATLQPAISYSWNSFGQTLHAEGDLLFIGDPQVQIDVTHGQGAVYVFKKIADDWIESHIIPAPLGETGFGELIEYENGELLIRSMVSNLKRVHVLSDTGTDWAFDELITAGGFSSGFAGSMHISGDLLAISNPTALAWQVGEVEVYRKENENWGQVQTFERGSTDGGFTSGFGTEVRVIEGTILVGDPQMNRIELYQTDLTGNFEMTDIIDGSIEIFGPSDFGSPIELSGIHTLVGAPGFNGSSSTGLVWTRTCVDTDADGVCDEYDKCEGSDDMADQDNDFIPDACDLCPNDPLNDADEDGACHNVDLCHGYDDTIDTDGDGIPNGCEGSDLAYCMPSFSSDCSDESTASKQYLRQIAMIYPAGALMSGASYETYLGHCPPPGSCNTENGNDYHFNAFGSTKDKCPGYPGNGDDAYLEILEFETGLGFDLFLLGNDVSGPNQLAAFGSSISVFVDWNQDGDFDDLNEMTVSTDVKEWNLTPVMGDNFFSIMIPDDAVNGTTRVRVIVSDIAFNTDACLVHDRGSAWDYQIDINAPESCPGDLTGDNFVGVNDFLQFNSAFGNTCDACPEDLNSDGVVDINDFLQLNTSFGTTCN